jgi:hypothetical protein
MRPCPFRLSTLLLLALFVSGIPPASADPPLSLTPSGSYYALIIGNDNYQFLPHLQTAANDAKAMARVLHEEYGFSTSVLINATRADIFDALITYRRKLPPESNLVIYYAGHGTNDAEARVAYWLPVDAQRQNNANWISADDITAELRVIKSHHVLVIADSCYSGALMRGGTDLDINRVKLEERDYYLTKLLQLKSRNVMASGGNEPVSDGGADGHSIFAAVLLQSLRELDARRFTASSLFQELVVRVAGRSQQTPQYSAIVNSQHDGGDFVFFRQPASAAPSDLCCARTGPLGGGPSDTTRDLPRSAGIEDVKDVLTQYQSAYDNEDLTELQRLWPTMPSKKVKDFQVFFRTARSVSLHCNIVGQPEITPATATISFVGELTYTLAGKKNVSSHGSTMRLRRSSDNSWKIEAIQ